MIRATSLLAALLVGGAIEAQARLRIAPHDLSASGAGAQANPEVDAWHDAEKAKIEEECDEKIAQIREEKRQKLKAIVDVREKEAAETGKALAEAQRRVGEEAAELAQEKLEAEKAAAKLPPLSADIKSGNKMVQYWLDKIKDLQKLIAEKKACIEELRRAQEELLEAQRRLAELKARLANKKRQRRAAEAAEQDAKEDIAEEDAELDDAEDDLAAAKARLE